MPRTPRYEVVAPGEVAVFHCVNRCVRRAFLCGPDERSHKNFDHRKGWIRSRLEFLAGQFGVEVLGFAVMSNHLHVILRSRPDVVSQWSDEEVARRWWQLFPARRNPDGTPAEPTEPELAVLQQPKALTERRLRLSHVSWFMRCLAEPVARRANREDNCTGRFWEGRFKCQPLLDETAIAACSIYVDLNPVRSGVAKTPETSEFTGAFERIHAAKPTARGDAFAAGVSPTVAGDSDKALPGQSRVAAPSPTQTPRDGWLSPVSLDEAAEKKAAKGTGKKQCAARRASHCGFLPMTLDKYLELLDWTGRQIRRDKRGAIPAELAPILERLQLSGETWIETVTHFGRWFHRAAGRPDSLAAEAKRRKQHWLAGIRAARQAFT